MITYINIQQADFNSVQFVANGDGVGTVLKVNLSKPPFNINFNSVLPDAFSVNFEAPSPGTASIATTGDGDILTVTFNDPLPGDSTVGVNVQFIYNSLT